MKNTKTIYLLLIVALLTITSCTPEDRYPEDIIGLWKLDEQQLNSTINNSSTDFCTFNGTYRFTNTNEVEAIGYTEDSGGNCVISYQESSTYSINNSTLTLNFNPVAVGEIMLLDATTLKFKAQDASDIVITTFTRQ